MSKYVNADELINQLEEYRSNADDDYADGKNKIIDVARILTAEMSSADVRENVSAHYIAESDGYADGNPVYDMWLCSNCKYLFDEYEQPTYRYCPNCGAKFER